MTERLLKGHEKAAREADAVSFAESLLNRLNQIDLRLRQLEEKQRLPESYFTADLKAGRSKRLPSYTDEAHLKGVLMDRLSLLENRIRQLSHDLDQGGGEGEIIAITSPTENQKLVLSSRSRREVAGPWRAGSDIFQSRESNKKTAKARDSTPAATTEAMDKRVVATFSRNEKRKMERSRIYRRWFLAGC